MLKCNSPQRASVAGFAPRRGMEPSSPSSTEEREIKDQEIRDQRLKNFQYGCWMFCGEKAQEESLAIPRDPFFIQLWNSTLAFIKNLKRHAIRRAQYTFLKLTTVTRLANPNGVATRSLYNLITVLILNSMAIRFVMTALRSREEPERGRMDS